MKTKNHDRQHPNGRLPVYFSHWAIHNTHHTTFRKSCDELSLSDDIALSSEFLMAFV